MPSVTYQLENVHVSMFFCDELIIWRLGQKMNCETLEFSLNVVAGRHLCILTCTGPPRPQSGQSEILY